MDSIERIKQAGIATRITNSQQAAEMGRKGGSQSTVRKRQAALLREWKRRGMPQTDEDELISRMSDPEADLLHIRKSIHEIKRSGCVKNVQQAATIMNLEMAAHKLQYGEKKDVKVTHGLTPGTLIESFEAWKNEVSGESGAVRSRVLQASGGAEELLSNERDTDDTVHGA